jgi:hypothetical protein
MAPTWVLEQKAVIVDGALKCVDCIQLKQREAKKAKRFSRSQLLSSATIAVAVLAGAGIFFPTPVLIFSLLACLAALLISAAGFGLSRRARLALAFVSLCAGSAGGWALNASLAGDTSRRIAKGFSAEESTINALLKQNCYREARLRWEAFDKSARNPAGAYKTDAAARQSKALEESLGGWLKRSYGSLSPLEQETLLRLFARYSSATTSGERRFQSIHFDGVKVALAVVSETALNQPVAAAGQAGADRSGAQLKEAAELIVFLHERMPEADSVAVTLLLPSANGQESATYLAGSAALNDVVQGRIAAVIKE